MINGEKSTIDNKRYYGFKTVDEMVQMLSDQHTIDNVLTRKFPVRLLKGWNGEKLVPAQLPGKLTSRLQGNRHRHLYRSHPVGHIEEQWRADHTWLVDPIRTDDLVSSGPPYSNSHVTDVRPPWWHDTRRCFFALPSPCFVL